MEALEADEEGFEPAPVSSSAVVECSFPASFAIQASLLWSWWRTLSAAFPFVAGSTSG